MLRFPGESQWWSGGFVEKGAKTAKRCAKELRNHEDRHESNAETALTPTRRRDVGARAV
jgi:hypothetical protein